MSSVLSSAATLFIIGPPRSGTTLLARLLNRHPSVLMTNETAVFLFFSEAIRRSRVGIKSGILWGKDYHELWSQHLARAAKPMIENFYEDIARLEKREKFLYWGEKHPHHDVCMSFLLELYPQGRFIFTLRDPRDSICSICEMNHWPFSKGLETWLRMSRNFEEATKEMGAEQLYRIRYEDVVDNYYLEVSRLLSWLGLDVDSEIEEAIRYYETKDANKRSSEPHDFKAKSVGRWRRELTPNDLDLVKSELRGFLDDYGYSID